MGTDRFDSTDNTGAWPGVVYASPHTSEHPEDNFWMIYYNGQLSLSQKYTNRSEAVAQCEKLAREKPDCRFYLLRVETSCTVEKSPARWRRP